MKYLMRVVAVVVVLAAQAAVAQHAGHKGSGSGSGSGSTASQTYAGQEKRAIAALSDEEIAGIRAGAGMGFAKAAELAGYPGPLHVLELAKELELTAEQRQKVQEIHAAMNRKAVSMGEILLKAEERLTQAFRSGKITADDLIRLVKEAEDARRDLRAIHLLAHIETKPLLSAEQVRKYDMLRGYANHDPSKHKH